MTHWPKWRLNALRMLRFSMTFVVTDEGYSAARLDFCADRVASGFISGAFQQVGVYVRPEDVSVRRDSSEVEDHGTYISSIQMTARWLQPHSTAALFEGGPLDGKVMTWERAPEPLTMPEINIRALLDHIDATGASEGELQARTVTYQMSGWDDDHRRWVYGL